MIQLLQDHQQQSLLPITTFRKKLVFQKIARLYPNIHLYRLHQSYHLQYHQDLLNHIYHPMVDEDNIQNQHVRQSNQVDQQQNLHNVDQIDRHMANSNHKINFQKK